MFSYILTLLLLTGVALSIIIALTLGYWEVQYRRTHTHAPKHK